MVSSFKKSYINQSSKQTKNNIRRDSKTQSQWQEEGRKEEEEDAAAASPLTSSEY